MDERTWQKLYDNVSCLPSNPTIVGFNVNLDRIITVTPDLLTSLAFNLPVLSELRCRLLHSMQTCTAEEWFVTDLEMYQRFIRIFADYGYLVIGGQAGIAAVHLASTGTSDLLCIAHYPGPETEKILDSAGVHLLDLKKKRERTSDTIHLVFEYVPGIVQVSAGVIPRNNRFIVSPLHPPESILMPGDSLSGLSAGNIPYTRAFLSGYQYLETGEEFRQAADQILLMKKNNPRMRVHVECVSFTDAGVINGFIRNILPAADSIGLNEHELAVLLRNQDSANAEPEIFERMSPVQQVNGALEIGKKSGLKRIHLHTFGYYVLVIRNDCVHPEASLNALLVASRAVAQAAQGTYTEISPFGISAYHDIEKRFGPPISDGVFRNTTHTIIMIPTIIVKDISKSSGLGDIISSRAFVADQF
jgi:ADP-dependent phosphofructokinase/glucokinase